MNKLYCTLYETAFALCALCVLSSAALPESGSVSSTNADYDGNALILKGQVMLDHGLGKMAAEMASLERQDNELQTNKDFPFSLIHLQTQVILTLKNSTQLHCDRADLNFNTLKGTLSSEENSKVTYIYPIKGQELKPLRLMSNQVDMEFCKGAYDGKKTDYEISSIFAKDDVVLDYANRFNLFADHAVYTRSETEEPLITIYPKNESACCELHHAEDRIQAKLIQLKPNSSELMLYEPTGMVFSSLIPHLEQGGMRFKSEQLIWNDQKNCLTLHGNAKVEESALGTLLSEKTITLTQCENGSKRTLQTIQAFGKTILHHLAKQHTSEQVLTSYGTLFIDREHLNATISSPVVDGATPSNLQIHYQEERFEIYGDNASMEYSVVGNTFQPVSLALKGAVRLSARAGAHAERCGLADRLHYSPTTRTLLLAANPGNKVLFWDKEEGMSISANEIHITFDPVTKKELIKGVGKVQFSLSQEESELLKKFFPIYKESHVSNR